MAKVDSTFEILMVRVMQPNVLTEYLGIKYPKWLDG